MAGACRVTADLDRADLQFRLLFEPSTTPIPGSTITRILPDPLHIRTVFAPGRSFGHLLRDNFEPIVNAELRFGLNPEKRAWVMMPEAGTPVDLYDELLNMTAKYTPLFMGKQTLPMDDVFPREGGALHTPVRCSQCAGCTKGGNTARLGEQGASRLASGGHVCAR